MFMPVTMAMYNNFFARNNNKKKPSKINMPNPNNKKMIFLMPGVNAYTTNLYYTFVLTQCT